MEWYPHHIDDFDADTLGMSLAEDGAYRRLICWYYRTERPLPNDDHSLANICRVTVDEWQTMSHKIRPFFKANGASTLHHKRCDKVLLLQTKKRKDGAARVARLRKHGIVES